MTGSESCIAFAGNVLAIPFVSSPHGRSRLRLEFGQGLLRVALDGRSLGWARPGPHWQYLAWIASRHEGSLALVPPIRSRDVGERSWPAFFARALMVGTPLAAGDWELSALEQHQQRDALLPNAEAERAPFAAHGLSASVHARSERVLEWVRSAAPNVIALRQTSKPEAARVKSWRKHARLGTLPPALLVWVSRLQAYLLLDGHDRVLAAACEGAPMRAVALYPYRDLGPDPDWIASASERYRRVFEHERQLAPLTREAANRALTASYAPYRQHTSVARYVPALRGQFESEHPDLQACDPRVRAAFE